MAATKKSLTERIGLVAAKAAEQPPVIITAADPVKARSDAAKEGILSIERLVKDLSEAISRADKAERHNEYLFNVNNQLRAEADHWHAKSEHFMRLNAEICADTMTVQSVCNGMARKLAQNSALVQRPAPKVTNNPTFSESEPPQFDADGIPYNAANGTAASVVTPEDIQSMLREMEQRDAAGNA